MEEDTAKVYLTDDVDKRIEQLEADIKELSLICSEWLIFVKAISDYVENCPMSDSEIDQKIEELVANGEAEFSKYVKSLLDKIERR